MRLKVFCSLFLFALMPGCSTPIHELVRDNINYGDSEERVKEILGAPKSFSTSESSRNGTWVYENSGAVCELKFADHKVEDMSCDASNYVSSGRKAARALGTVLKGAGDGIKEGARQPLPQPIHTFQQPVRCTRDFGLTESYTCQ
jgi:hypothetical protein